MTPDEHFQLVVVGGGPSGQKAAIQGAKEGLSVLLVERSARIGGECVHRGTIPSKTLRENAVYLSGLRRRSEGVLSVELSPDLKVASLMRRLKAVLRGHEQYIGEQLGRNAIDVRTAKARFLTPDTMAVEEPSGRISRVRGETFVIATGSRPRRPAEVPVDHEHVLDSDSILSLIYLPESLTVLGGGVIASEFATIFAALGVEVTMIDRHGRPLGFLDGELTDAFVTALKESGVRFLPERRVESVRWDGLAHVETLLEGGERVRSQKLLCALGRAANVRGLNLQAAGVGLTERGHVAVDENCQTSASHVYAVGDVIGPPSLAATSIEQGRRAVRHALGLEPDGASATVPIGIYAIPEMASVGLREDQAIARFGSAVVGRAPFAELARGQISGNVEGLIKLVADPHGKKLLGAHVIGEGATELIHVAQMALVAGLDVDVFVDNVFNFPTLAEGYRVAALEVVDQRLRSLRQAG